MKQKIKKLPEPRLFEYEVALEASYQCYETATITVMASNSTEAEEMAIAETQDGQHFGNGEFEGYCGWDSDVDLEVQSVERSDGEEDDEDEDDD